MIGALAAVEPMTDDDLYELQNAVPSMGAPYVWVSRLLARLDAAESRALPLPRRYTGGPLEDGLYLCRPAPHWFVGTNGWWLVDPNTRDGKDELSDIVETSFDVWLIGPIHIPSIPESEEASS